jgi:hypothetical protein
MSKDPRQIRNSKKFYEMVGISPACPPPNGPNRMANSPGIQWQVWMMGKNITRIIMVKRE